MNEETMIMDTVKINIIQGSINGILKEDFDMLVKKAQIYFKNVRWNNETMFINNWGGEQYLGTFNEIELLFTLIANAISEGKYGKLGFIGLVGKREIAGIVFFGHKKWELKEFTRPETPAWYKTEEWFQKEKWREELEWDEIFGR